jgi:hypothetical protein
LPFACTQIIKLTSSATEANQIKGQTFIGNKVVELPIGRPVDAVVEKNKLGPQSRTASYNLYYDGPTLGVDRLDELVTMAEATGAVRRSGRGTISTIHSGRARRRSSLRSRRTRS